jgi:hypothetical protein
MQSSAPAPGAQSPWDSVLGATEDSISQCTFLQMTYTVEKQHADDISAPGARPRFLPSCRHDPHGTAPAPMTMNRITGRQMSCRQQTAPPQSRCSKDVTIYQHRSGSRPDRPCPVPACSGQQQSGQRRFSWPLRNRIFFVMQSQKKTLDN